MGANSAARTQFLLVTDFIPTERRVRRGSAIHTSYYLVIDTFIVHFSANNTDVKEADGASEVVGGHIPSDIRTQVALSPRRIQPTQPTQLRFK